MIDLKKANISVSVVPKSNKVNFSLDAKNWIDTKRGRNKGEIDHLGNLSWEYPLVGGYSGSQEAEIIEKVSEVAKFQITPTRVENIKKAGRDIKHQKNRLFVKVEGIENPFYYWQETVPEGSLARTRKINGQRHYFYLTGLNVFREQQIKEQVMKYLES